MNNIWNAVVPESMKTVSEWMDGWMNEWMDGWMDE